MKEPKNIQIINLELDRKYFILVWIIFYLSKLLFKSCMSIQRVKMLFQKSSLFYIWKCQKVMAILKQNISTNAQFFSCFRKSCLFELSQPTVSPDLDHSPGSKQVWLFVHSLKKCHPILVSKAQAVTSPWILNFHDNV